MILAPILYAMLVVGSGALVLIGLDTVRSGFDRYEERAAIVDRPLSGHGSIALGSTAVAGTARPDGHPERVPFGGRERAVLYEMRVDDTNKAETAHVDERTAPPFVLESDAADEPRVRVDASELRLDLSADRRWSTEVASHDPLPDDLAAFADANDLPEQGLERDREFAYEYLAPGDEVFVYGRAVPDADRSLEGKAVLVTAHEDGTGFLSDKAPDALLAERRRALVKHVSLGAVEAVVGLAAFLWLTGIAQFLLGA